MQQTPIESNTRSVRIYAPEIDLHWAKILENELRELGLSDVSSSVPNPEDFSFVTGPSAPIVVLMLSPEFLINASLPSIRDVNENEPNRLVGLIVREIRLTEVLHFLILGGSSPLDDMSEIEAHFKIDRVANEIAELAGVIDVPPSQSQAGDSFAFSPASIRVLEKSRELSLRKRLRAITAACLFFGFTESRRATPTAAFFRDLVAKNQRYEHVFESYMQTGDEKIEGIGLEVRPFAGFFTPDAHSILKHAQTISHETSSDGIIHARHILAAMLLWEPVIFHNWSVWSIMKGLGAEVSVLLDVRKYVAGLRIDDDPHTWDRILGSEETAAKYEMPSRLPLERILVTLDESGQRFLREVAKVALRLERPADTFSALALLLGWASEKREWAAEGILDELRRQTNQADVVKMLGAPSQYWQISRLFPDVQEVAADLVLTLERTKEFGVKFSLEGDLSLSVFLAVIIGFDPVPVTKVANVAKLKLAELGFDLNAIRVAYRRFLAKTRPEDPRELYDELLGPVSQEPLSATPQIAVEPNPDAYQKGYSAFASDHVSYDRRDRSQPLDDALGVGVYADNIAQLIAAQKTKMPLSIGLFGDWGSGKSYFMALLQERLSGIAESNTSAFHKRIVQIRFNAWHYLDTNLWASLVCEIFDQLFGALEENNDTTDAQIRQLKEELARESALAAEAKEALTIAENARLKAENELRAAIREREHAETKVATLLNDLTVLIGEDEGVKKELDAAAAGLGLPALKDSYEELNQRVAEVRTIGGRARALGLAVFAGSGWWTRSLLLVVAISLPLLIGWIGTLDIPWIRDLLSGAGKAITQIAAAILAVSGWIAQQARRGNSLLNKLEDAHKKVSEIRERRQSEDDASKAEKVLAQKRQEEEQARHTLNEAEERMKKLRAELSGLAPGRQLIRFLKERASADDYRRHLGLVSLVRRDFEKLSQLMLDAHEARVANLPKIDRIVLYIDDLDRCRADRVVEVLEAVHLLLAFPLFAVVVAVDPRWLRQSLLDHYPSLLGGREMKSLSGNPSRPPATPQDYLEKIFQVPFNLKDLDKEGYGALVKGLFEIAESSPTPNKDTSPVTLSIEKSVKSDQENQMAVKQNEEVGKDVASVDPSTRQVPVETVSTTLTEPEVAKVIPAAPPAPPDPARLLLSGSEIADASLFQPLFRTPRAVKRFANTYCLIRVGVNESDWPTFVGSTKAYRAPMFMLAVTSAYPALSRPWLTWLRTAEVPEWTKITPEQVGELSLRFADSTEKLEWENLAAGLDSLKLANWNTGAFDGVHEWIGRVSRFTF